MAAGVTGGSGRARDVEGIWRGMAPELTTFAVPKCGHLPHEERPAEVNASLLDFLGGWKG